MWQSVKEYVRAVGKRWWVLVVGVCLPIIGIILDAWQELAIPNWVWFVIIIVGLVIASFLAFHELRRKQAPPPANWIDAHKARHGEYPPLPDYLLQVVEGGTYSRGEPVSKKIKVKIASGQTWNRLLPSQQEELLQLVEWLGQDRRDYLAQMERMRIKKAPNGTARWSTPKQD